MAKKIDYWKLTDIQRQIFRKKLIENKISILSLPIEPYETENRCYPLSHAQREIFPFVQNEEEAAAYNMCSAIRIYKNINLELLQEAVQLLVEKYEVMRIYFVEREGAFFQKVKEKLQVKIETTDLQDELLEKRECILLELLTIAGRIPFSVFDFPLFRFSLYRLSLEECVLGINISHLITDGISLQIITADLLNTYADLEEGRKVAFSTSPIKYTDYALWQNEWIQPDMLQPELAFWKKTLKGIKTRYSLPEDLKRPKVSTFESNYYEYQIDEELTALIRSYTSKNGVSIFQFMMTVYMILVSRYLMSPDVALSIPVSGRLRKETQHIVGFFAHGMAIRGFIEEEKTFVEVLNKIASSIEQAFNNQIVPLSLIGEILDEQESKNLGNLFDMFFIFHNYQECYQDSALKIPFVPVYFGNQVAKGDISIELTERKKNIDITMEYNTALYRQETIQAFIEHYINLIRNCINFSQKPLKELRIEKTEVLWDTYNRFNHTVENYNYHRDLYSVIEEQAKTTPNHIALVTESENLTYEALLSEVEKMQGYLLQQGINKGDCIGIHLESSKELLIALLAVLKTGCTYIPLDPTLPEKRTLYIQKKTNMVAILNDKKNDLVAKEKMCSNYYVGKEADFWKENVVIPQIYVAPSDNAYIMFTSGSTGYPKGVQISHENLMNFLFSIKEKLDFREKQSILSVTTYAFDISVLELFLPLICGGKVIIWSNQISTDLIKLRQTIKEQQPDYLQATPTLWRRLLANDFGEMNEITALCGGEALDKELAKTMNKVCKKVFNLYGPTETTVWSLMYQLEGEDPEVFIGKPIGNTMAYILDANNKLLPPGLVGKLYIGGAGVSKGYLNDIAETNKRFVDNPFGNGKLFYTGDLAKCHVDGIYEYCGRDDHQVKIRGYRIEMEETEICLKKRAIIENCAVVAVEGNDGEKILVAYIKLANGIEKKPDIEMLRGFIREELPEYMIPSVFRYLEDLPITYNFKIDKKQLMELKIEDRVEDAYVPPKNSMQIMLVDMWEQTMQKEKIGITDNFYCIGGHSLSMIRIKELIYKKTGISIPLSWFSKYPTVEKMAEQLQCMGRKRNVDEIVAKHQKSVLIDKEHLYEPFDLTPVQTAYWMGRCSKGSLGGVSTHIYRECVVKNLDLEKFEKAVNLVIARHDMLRAIILEDGRQQIQKAVPYFTIKRHTFLECNNKKADIELELQCIRNKMQNQVFSSNEWPMFDIQFCQMSNSIGRVLMSFDCLIGDARSFQIILSELAMCYIGRENELKNLEFSFRDYVVISKQLVSSYSYQTSKKYWIDKLSQIPDKPLLPLKCNPDSIYKPVFARKTFSLDKEQYRRLKEIAELNHVTKTVVLLTAFSVILALYSKKSAFTLDLTLFDRNIIHQDIPNLVGDFTTGTLLEINMDGNETPKEYAKRIQEKLIDNLEHRQFSSIDVTRELLKRGYINESYPVVFTSMLDAYEEEHMFEESLKIIDDEESLSYNISQTPQVWLDHQVMEWNGTLFLNWDYVEDLFEEQVITTMFSDYQKLILELLNEKTWLKIEPLAQDMTKYPYGEWLKPALSFQEEEFLDELLITGFLKQVRENGEKIAIIHKDKTITYEELDQISDYVAFGILKRKESSECIGIAMQKGWEQIVAALAILKVGKAYVPIDMELPEERINKIINTCDINMCLTTKSFSGNVDKFVDSFIISNDYFSKVLTVEEKAVLNKVRVQTRNQDKAYVIFTSGSTGEPKGVVISHKGAMNTIHDINKRFAVSEKDSVLALSSMSFDLSVYDVFGMLSAGGSIVLPEYEYMKDPNHWNFLLEQYRITIWNSVPAFMNIYTELDEKIQKGIKNLRLILLSGDWIPVDLPEKIWKQNHNVELISLGGATECSIWSIWHPITEVKAGQTSIPYGKSLSGQQVYVLNKKNMICPIGVEGDIYIGGTGLAKEYLKDEDKTKRKFVNHSLLGKRLYDTGDIGKYTVDGSILFLGRQDGQVKINGYRIEREEIQAAIRRYPGVEDTVVALSKKDRNILVAYVKRTKKIDQEEGLILDSIERKLFKLEQKNIRKDIEDREILLENKFQEADYFMRNSCRNYSKTTIPFGSISALLSVLSGYQRTGMLLPKYQYASAGSLYPVQLYIYIKEERVENLESGYYYYNPVHNSLQMVYRGCDNQTLYHVQQNKEIQDNSAFSIYLVANLDAIQPLYGTKNAKIFSLLEAGMMTSLLEREGLKQGIGFCQIGTLNFDIIRERLRLSKNHEYLHMLLGGAINADIMEQNHILTSVQPKQGEGLLNKQSEYTAQLKEYLRDVLPNYMIPQHIVVVDEIPLTQNGKVDYKKLSGLEMEDKTFLQENDSHISDEEAAILEIWKRVLERSDIGVNDNFFDVGGTSLKIVQMHKLLSKEIKQDFDIISLFQNPTIKTFIEYINKRRKINKVWENAAGRAEKRLKNRRKRDIKNNK